MCYIAGKIMVRNLIHKYLDIKAHYANFAASTNSNNQLI